MNDIRLRNHIPISGPATREPYIGDGTKLRVSLGFTPNWFHQRLGINFSEPWHLDPDYRYETLIEMKQHLHKVFPSVSYFKPNYKNGVEKTCATISGVHGIMLIPALYGLEIEYGQNRWPDAKPDKNIPKEELRNLKPINLETNTVFQQLIQQMDHIDKKWGWIHGYLNYQGILNIALKVRGNDIFLDMYDDPQFVVDFFTHIADTIRSVSKIIQKKQRKSGFYINLLSMSNCVMNMISPDQYEKFVLPLDQKLSNDYERFGIHTCNWDTTPYLDKLRKISKMGYLDTGMMADLEKIKNLFPNTRRAVLYGPVELENKQPEEIENDIQEIADLYSPCDIVMADVESTTPDKRINFFLATVREIEGSLH